MRRKFVLILILLIAISATLMTGCKKKIEEKIAEKFIEKTIEDATGGKVDINKDTATIKTEQGETKVGDNLKWPKDKVGNLPELKANIVMITEDIEKTLVFLSFDSLKTDDAEKYLESIKKLKYESVFETTSGDGFMYSGKDEDGSEVVFSYFNDGTGSLSYTDKQFMFTENPYDSNSPGDTSSNEDVDMTDDVPWPKDFFKDIPELEGKIIEVSSGSPQDKFVYIEYVTKEDAMGYLDKLKKLGFTETPSESVSGGYLNYEAGNENGDYIIFDWSDSGYATISLAKGE